MVEYAGFPDGDWKMKDFEEIAQKAGFESPDEWYSSILEEEMTAINETIERLEAERLRLESSTTEIITVEDFLKEIGLEDETIEANQEQDLRNKISQLERKLHEQSALISDLESKRKANSGVIQNITYNITDSSIVTDEFGTAIGKKEN